LFIGYGLRDWNIRAMLRAFRLTGPGKDVMRSFAVQRSIPSELTDDEGRRKRLAEWRNSRKYWDKKENVQMINMSAIDFASKLHQRFFS
jgi:hypothetical protein